MRLLGGYLLLSAIFEDKGRIADVVKPIPVFVITDPFPAFKGCAAALNAG